MSETTDIEKALLELFDELDQEKFDRVAGLLHDQVELADELTGEWLRGRDRVAAYLFAQRGVVTDVASRLTSVHSQWLSQAIGLATFVAEQRYSLDGVPRREDLTGSAMFSFSDTVPRLMLFHLGASATAQAGEEQTRPAPSTSAETLPEALRRRRRDHGLSLRELAARSSLSPSFLSQLERGLADPSVSSLRRLAQALDAGVHELLGEQAASRFPESVVVRRDERPRLRMPHAGAEYELLTPSSERALGASLVTLEPSEGSIMPARTGVTEEFVLVLEGLLNLQYGTHEITLSPGDTAYLDSTVPQRLAPAGSKPASFLAVVTPNPDSQLPEPNRLSPEAADLRDTTTDKSLGEGRSP